MAGTTILPTAGQEAEKEWEGLGEVMSFEVNPQRALASPTMPYLLASTTCQ
jgi:hypothetical protein